MKEHDGKLGLIELIGLVVGSIIGGGVFNLMHDMSTDAGAGAIIIGWVITAIGMVMLALTFQNLTMKRSDLDAGVYSYAEAGFGKYMGFNSAWGYWLSAWLGNVGYATLLMSAVAYFLNLQRWSKHLVNRGGIIYFMGLSLYDFTGSRISIIC